MKAVALCMAIVGATLTVLGLLSELEVVNVGTYGTWLPIVGVPMSLLALTIFKKTVRT